MPKIRAISFEPLRKLMVLPVVCWIVFASACAQQPSPASSSAAYPSPPVAQTSATKIKLNGEDVGTTADTSVLGRKRTEVCERRRDEGPCFVFIRADNSALFSEVNRVIEAVITPGILFLSVEVDPARLGKASGDPVGTDGKRIVPRSQMLVVTVGGLGSPGGESISGGIRLFIPEFTLRVSQRHSIPKEFTVVEVFKDNQYVIGEKSIPSSALRGELQAGLKERIDKRVVILTRSDSEIRWSSFMEVANAAFEAGAEMIHFHNLTP